MKIRKKLQWGSVSLLLLLIVCFNLYHIILNPVDLQTPYHYENERTLQGTVVASNYTPEFTGNGEDCNVTLRQSLIDTSPITITNTSDSLNNTIYEPCPTTENFPSSVVNMTIEDIYAPNKTLILESHSGFPDYDFDLDNAKTKATSFTIKGNCYLNNISIYLNNEGSEAIVYAYLYNSTWYEDGANSRCIPDGGPLGKPIGTFTVPASTFDWFYLDGLNEVLINSKTDNNTWFIGLLTTGSYDNGWLWRLDTIGSDTNSVWYNISALPKWQTEIYDSTTIDYYLDVTLSPYLSPPNQTLIVEDGPDSNNQQFDDVRPSASSFEVEGDCFLEKVSVELHNPNSPDNITVRYVLYNSTWNSTDNVSMLGGYKQDYTADLGTVNYSATLEWVTLSGLHIFLENSETENNTWFIGLSTTVNSLHEGYWEWNWISQGNGIDDTRSYTYQTFPYTKWILTEAFDQKVDFHLKLDLRPPSNTPKPENINLKVNNSIVTGIQNQYGTGYWLSTDAYLSLSGNIAFILSADWWDVSCTITSIQIIYTKTDVKANTNFNIVGSGQEVFWNVTESEGLNYLDSRINETASINFTIPTSWYNIHVFNGTTNKTDDILIRSLNSRYDEIYVLNAGSGYWFLTASSENLLESIDSYIGSRPENIFNYSNIVHFNASFKETLFQNDGLINLSIYSPALINDVLNFTVVKTMFGTGKEISLGEWDISDNVTQYGVFRVQVSWYNGTAVGFMEANLIINGESDLLLIEPPQDAIYDPNQQFNIIVYYEDAQSHKAINGAVINFNIANQGWEATTVTNGTTGYYEIPVDCSEIPFIGSNCVEISATREFYSTQVLEYIFEISESTTTTNTTTTATTIQTDSSTSTSTVTTTTTIKTATHGSTTTTTETGTFSGVLLVLAVFSTLVIFTRRRKKV